MCVGQVKHEYPNTTLGKVQKHIMPLYAAHLAKNCCLIWVILLCTSRNGSVRLHKVPFGLDWGWDRLRCDLCLRDRVQAGESGCCQSAVLCFPLDKDQGTQAYIQVSASSALGVSKLNCSWIPSPWCLLNRVVVFPLVGSFLWVQKWLLHSVLIHLPIEPL